MNNCLHCNALTTNPRYCSRSCAAKELNKIPKRKLGKYRCKTCHVPIKSGYMYCSDCWSPGRGDITLNEAIYTRHHKSSAYALVRTRARQVTKNRPQVCSSCGYNKHVEVCHIKPISSFDETTLLSTINAEDNLKLLCPNCHWEFDNL